MSGFDVLIRSPAKMPTPDKERSGVAETFSRLHAQSERARSPHNRTEKEPAGWRTRRDIESSKP